MGDMHRDGDSLHNAAWGEVTDVEPNQGRFSRRAGNRKTARIPIILIRQRLFDARQPVAVMVFVSSLHLDGGPAATGIEANQVIPSSMRHYSSEIIKDRGPDQSDGAPGMDFAGPELSLSATFCPGLPPSATPGSLSLALLIWRRYG